MTKEKEIREPVPERKTTWIIRYTSGPYEGRMWCRYGTRDQAEELARERPGDYVIV